MSGHVAQALAAPVRDVLCLVDACYVFCYHGFSKHLKPFEDALVGEVEVTIAVAAVLLDGLFEETFLCNVSLFAAVVAEVVAASALKKRMVYQTTAMQGQGHPVFGCCAYQGVGNVSVSYLLQGLHLFHLSLYSIHLHIDCKQGA